MDRSGDIAVGYSVAGPNTFPGIRYAGRLADDPAGTLGQGEVTLVNGTGVQTQSTSHWGDYSMMSVDPRNDCTFWYAQEYYTETGKMAWHTRIGSFKFPSCRAYRADELTPRVQQIAQREAPAKAGASLFDG